MSPGPYAGLTGIPRDPATGALLIAGSGPQLGLASLASTWTQIAALQNSEYDVTGMAITVVVAARPILLRAVLPAITFSVASSNLQLKLYEGATQLQSASWGSSPTASRGFAGFVEVPLSPAAGNHTYKLTVRPANAGGDISVISGATAPAYISAVEQ